MSQSLPSQPPRSEGLCNLTSTDIIHQMSANRDRELGNVNLFFMDSGRVLFG